ncbi:MAG: hypothetical protein C4536_01125 [Actinobacteria bacterium]|jgi:hypothetical protein|nr:MAG: hypothetical protein C4536_01125 [Actinomycetota bacterium]
MAAMRRCLIALPLAMLLFAGAYGCGNPYGKTESAWREEVNASLAALEDSAPYSYDIHIETWVGVSGQSVYGDEKGVGAYVDGDFSVSILRTYPAGEENLVYTSLRGISYLREGETWRPIDAQEVPSPLYDPELFTVLASAYGSISLEGEEELSDVLCRRYLLQLGREKAQEALPERAWSYFSPLDFELNCRIWVADASTPPLSLRLEVIGFDREERLQRYRVVATLNPHDFRSEEIQLMEPGV